MKASELSAPAGEAFDFDEIGATVEGVVAYVGDWYERISKFTGNPETITKIGIDVGGGQPSYVYPKRGSQMAQAIADALRAAELNELAEGQTLKLRFDSEKDTGKGKPMKVFRAKITAGELPAKPLEEPF